jgi:hypothetical protein
MIFVDSGFDPAGLDTSPRRLTMVEGVLAAFGRAFPELHFGRIEDTFACNAQAIVLSGRREVRLYGGLAFHPGFSEDAIAFALLHEAGHHLATGRRLPWDPRLACECVADGWATSEGEDAWRRERPGYSLETALAELGAVLSERAPAEDEFACDGECFALSWASRTRVLVARTPVSASNCPLAQRIFARNSERGGDHGHADRNSQ